MIDIHKDIKSLYAALKRVERQAEDLRWADKRPWFRKTHIWIERGLIVLDFHDLNTKLMKEAFKESVRIAKDFETGAICYISGVGKHSEGGFSKNKEILMKMLDKEVSKKKDWEWQPHGMGRMVLIIDKEKAPPSATGKLSPTMKFAIGAFAVLVIFSILHNMWPK